MKSTIYNPDRSYWAAMTLFSLATLLFILLNSLPAYPDQYLKLWLSYLASDRPERKEMAVAELRQSSKTVLPQLLRMIHSGDTNLQAQAVLAFVAMNGHARPATPRLAQLLRHEATSLAAARALAGIGRSSLPVLTNALNSPVRYVRSNAARGIGLLGFDAHPAVPLLVRVLEDRDDNLRYFASRALGRIAAEPEQAVPALVTRINDPSREVRKMAILSLGKFHEQAKVAVPALRHKALRGVNQDVRNAAVFALNEIDPTWSAAENQN